MGATTANHRRAWTAEDDVTSSAPPPPRRTDRSRLRCPHVRVYFLQNGVERVLGHRVAVYIDGHADSVVSQAAHRCGVEAGVAA
jgi:hypothetical protein